MVAITSISLYTAWQNALDTDMVSREQWFTQKTLNEINLATAKYQEKRHQNPQSYEQLLSLTNDFDLRYCNEEFLDGWKRPFLISSNETSFLVTSYGRDGKPGGVGLDCDLTSKDWKPKESALTFVQFFTNALTRGMVVSCFVCGVFAFLTSFFTVKKWQHGEADYSNLFWRLAMTVGGALIAAIFISALHVPSGH